MRPHTSVSDGNVPHSGGPHAAASESLTRWVPTVCTVLAALLAILGVIQMGMGEAVTRLFQGWPEGLPGRPYWAHGAGVVVLGLGGLGLLRVRPRLMLAALAGVVVLAVFTLHLPRAVASGEFGDGWLNVCKWLAMAAGLMLAAEASPAAGRWSWVDVAIQFFAAHAKWFLAVFLVGAAIVHVRFAAPIAQYYIPAYLPGRVFWAWFSAAALAAGGVGLIVPTTARLAAWLSGLMIFLWCPLLHIPRTWAEPRNPNEWCGVFESLAFAAILVLLALRPRSFPRPTPGSGSG